MEDIIRKLDKFTLESKLGASFLFSRELVNIQGTLSSERMGDPTRHPWCIETFALISILFSKQCASEDILHNDNFYIAREVLYDINALMNLKLKDNQPIGFVDALMPYLGSLQFKSQENYLTLMYRSNYFFNFSTDKLDMMKAFNLKFNSDYKKFKEMALILNVFVTHKSVEGKIMAYFREKYSEQIASLTVDVEEVRTTYNNIKNENVFNAIKPFWQTPYLSINNQIYLVTPHLIYRSITDAFLFRLTENNDKLRNQFGSECLETYIKHLFEIGKKYDDIIGEIEYKTSLGVKRSSDILIRKNTNVLLIEAKAFVPSQKLRELDIKEIEKVTKRHAESLIQVFIQAKHEINKSYFPFVENDINQNKIYGLVVLLEDSFVSREKIYLKAKELLIEKEIEFNYIELTNKFKVISLYELEQMTFYNLNVITEIKKFINKKKPFDFFSSSHHSYKSNGVFNKFINDQSELMVKIADDMVNKGIIKPK